MQGHDTDRTKFDDRDYSVTCHQCGNTFEATRSDASFCSAKCRVAFSREPQKLNNAIEAVNSMRVQLEELSRRYSQNDRMFQAMLDLQKGIGAALGNFEK